MRIDTSKIDGYDSMDADQLKSFIENFDFDDHSSTAEKYKSAFDKASKEAAEFKRKLREKLNDEERIEIDRKTAEEETARILKEKDDVIAKLMKEKSVAKYTAAFSGIGGFTEETSKAAAEDLASGNIDNFLNVLKNAFDAHSKELKKQVLSSTPTPPPESGNKPLSRSEFFNLSHEEQIKYISAHPNWKQTLK